MWRILAEASLWLNVLLSAPRATLCSSGLRSSHVLKPAPPWRRWSRSRVRIWCSLYLWTLYPHVSSSSSHSSVSPGKHWSCLQSLSQTSSLPVGAQGQSEKDEAETVSAMASLSVDVDQPGSVAENTETSRSGLELSCLTARISFYHVSQQQGRCSTNTQILTFFNLRNTVNMEVEVFDLIVLYFILRKKCGGLDFADFIK